MAMGRAQLAVVLIAVAIMGCVGTVKHEMTTDFPATVRYVVGTPPAQDGRARFRQIFCRTATEAPGSPEAGDTCDDLLWRFNDEPAPEEPSQPVTHPVFPYRVLIVPGFLNDCFANIALPFEEAMASLNGHGFKIEILAISGRSGSASNADDIAAAIDRLGLGEDEKLVLVGHSKGALDILYCLVNHPQVSRHVAAVVSIAGAINGSPLAYHLEDVFQDLVRNFLPRRCKRGDEQALYSLVPSHTITWLAEHPLPKSVRYFSLATVTTRKHMNTFLKPGYDLLSIYSPRNDGLLLVCDQIIPGSTLLGYANTDHWSVVLPLENKPFLISDTVQAPWPFPRKALLQAILDYVAESLAQ